MSDCVPTFDHGRYVSLTLRQLPGQESSHLRQCDLHLHQRLVTVREQNQRKRVLLQEIVLRQQKPISTGPTILGQLHQNPKNKSPPVVQLEQLPTPLRRKWTYT